MRMHAYQFTTRVPHRGTVLRHLVGSERRSFETGSYKKFFPDSEFAPQRDGDTESEDRNGRGWAASYTVYHGLLERRASTEDSFNEVSHASLIDGLANEIGVSVNELTVRCPPELADLYSRWELKKTFQFSPRLLLLLSPEAIQEVDDYRLAMSEQEQRDFLNSLMNWYPCDVESVALADTPEIGGWMLDAYAQYMGQTSEGGMFRIHRILKERAWSAISAAHQNGIATSEWEDFMRFAQATDPIIPLQAVALAFKGDISLEYAMQL